MYWTTILDELNILFSVPPKCILDKDTSGDNPGGNWLPGAYLNPARNCLTNGLNRSSDDTVIRWRDQGSDHLPVNTMTLVELRVQVWYDFSHPYGLLFFNEAVVPLLNPIFKCCGVG